MTHWSNISLVIAISMAILLFAHAHNEPQDYVDAHQCIRKVLSLNPLCWDEKLAKDAEAYAQQRTDCKMIGSGKCGENLAAGPDLNASYAVQMWIDERKNYDIMQDKCAKGSCCHYKQVVWRNTERVGCARIKCTEEPCFFIVCNYDPPGNVAGQAPY